MSGPRSLASLLQPIARQALGKRGAALGALFADWPAIVGEALAQRAVPDRLSFPAGRRDGGVLTLRVEPADALEVQHDAPRLIERINAHYGYRAIERLALIQAPPHRPRRSARRPLAPTEQAELEAALAGIADERLRARLTELGQALYGRGEGK